MTPLFPKRLNLINCIEQSFFKTIILISIVGCAVVILLELKMTGRFDLNLSLMILLIQVLLVTLYSINRIDFSKVTTLGLLMLAGLFTYRGIVTDEFREITYTLLITIGFISSLVSRGRRAIILKIIILGCLLVLLFKNHDRVAVIMLVRRAVPYLVVFAIVTICSGILKFQYEKNQQRLREMVDLLNLKNRKINEQHFLLKKNYDELTQLNENLEGIIAEKTHTITEKNAQLAQIAFANAHTIRGPLARILGLINLARLEPEHKDDYYCIINKEANDMDTILFKVTREIEKNIL